MKPFMLQLKLLVFPLRETQTGARYRTAPTRVQTKAVKKSARLLLWGIQTSLMVILLAAIPHFVSSG